MSFLGQKSANHQPDGLGFVREQRLHGGMFTLPPFPWLRAC
nr:MAG TPA: hypothetical protein [Caudoviricetes sp.]